MDIVYCLDINIYFIVEALSAFSMFVFHYSPRLELFQTICWIRISLPRNGSSRSVAASRGAASTAAKENFCLYFGFHSANTLSSTTTAYIYFKKLKYFNWFWFLWGSLHFHDKFSSWQKYLYLNVFILYFYFVFVDNKCSSGWPDKRVSPLYLRLSSWPRAGNVLSSVLTSLWRDLRGNVENFILSYDSQNISFSSIIILGLHCLQCT